MSNLNKEDKEIILDFYFRCGSEDDINRGRDLIASNEEAAQLYANLEDTLTGLDSIKYEPCPDNLTELTIARLKLAAAESTSQNKLNQLLADEQKNENAASGSTKVTTRRTFWRSITDTAAVAAMIALVFTVGYPALSNVRQNSWKVQCAANMAGVGNAMARYASSNNDSLPSVPVQAGSPWWKIGDQGEKNQSNTRHVWLLVKEGYLKGEEFVCPGRKDSQALNLPTEKIAALQDFPSRKNVDYSFMVMCEEATKRQRAGRLTALMADRNPIFEKVQLSSTSPSGTDEFIKIMLNDKLRTMTSTNHKGRGQNILLSGGSANFKKDRLISNDDIYTVSGTDSYSGKELPCKENDFFLAP
jgi:hypothetical protein